MENLTGCRVNPGLILASEDRALDMGPRFLGSRVFPFDAIIDGLVIDAVAIFVFHRRQLLGLTGMLPSPPCCLSPIPTKCKPLLLSHPGITYRFKPISFEGRVTAKRINKQFASFYELHAAMTRVGDVGADLTPAPTSNDSNILLLLLLLLLLVLSCRMFVRS